MLEIYRYFSLAFSPILCMREICTVPDFPHTQLFGASEALWFLYCIQGLFIKPVSSQEGCPMMSGGLFNRRFFCPKIPKYRESNYWRPFFVSFILLLFSRPLQWMKATPQGPLMMASPSPDMGWLIVVPRTPPCSWFDIMFEWSKTGKAGKRNPDWSVFTEYGQMAPPIMHQGAAMFRARIVGRPGRAGTTV